MSANPRNIDPETGFDTTSVQAMIRGEKYVYHPDPYRAHLVNRAAKVLEAFNAEKDENVRAEIMRGFLNNHSGEDKPVWIIVAPFFCDYGMNISLGSEVFIGAGATILDTCPVTIGSRTLIGPNVSIYTPFHPTSPEERDSFRGHQDQGKPVVIGEDCWIAGSVTILPGVTIGKGSTIGAGSVVVKDIPARSVAVGNPARVVRTIPLPE